MVGIVIFCIAAAALLGTLTLLGIMLVIHGEDSDNADNDNE